MRIGGAPARVRAGAARGEGAIIRKRFWRVRGANRAVIGAGQCRCFWERDPMRYADAFKPKVPAAPQIPKPCGVSAQNPVPNRTDPSIFMPNMCAGSVRPLCKAAARRFALLLAATKGRAYGDTSAPWARGEIMPQRRAARSDQTRVFHRRAHEILEQGMRCEGFGFQFGVELHADKPRMIFPFDNFGQAAIGGHAREL